MGQNDFNELLERSGLIRRQAAQACEEARKIAERTKEYQAQATRLRSAGGRRRSEDGAPEAMAACD
jgi:hypothetical protein